MPEESDRSKKTDTQPGSQEEMMQMMDKTPESQFKPGDSVTGTVVSKDDTNLFLDIGDRAEAVIKRGELVQDTEEGDPAFEKGDKVEAYVVDVNEEGIEVSKSLDKKKGTRKDLKNAMDNKIPVKGKITGVNKGGFNVSVMGKSGFCPFSGIDTVFIDDPADYLRKTYSFIIDRIEDRGRNIVLTRLPLLKKEVEKRLSELEESAENGEVIETKITRITNFGMFTDLGGVEGLIHISEVSWDKVDNLNDMFSTGQPVKVVVKSVERNEPLSDSRISLSMRLVSGDPWKGVEERYTSGDTVEGRVTKIVNFGAFVQLEEGVEGLIHISELSWKNNVRTPSEVVSEGDIVRVNVLKVNPVKKSISLSLKDASEDPWAGITEKFPVGSKQNGVIADKKRFGYFIDLDENITGLLPFANIAKDKKDSIKKGDEIEVDIKSIDSDERKISLAYGIETEKKVSKETTEKYTKDDKKNKASTTDFGEKLRAALKSKD